jgi:tRNA (Thr-GGU) A37 N-methylase
VTGCGQDGKGRVGDVSLPLELSARQDAGLVFIGRVRSSWQPGDCPHNLAEARARGGGRAALEIDPAFRAGLEGLASGDAVIVVTFLDATRRDLIVQTPRHRPGPAGTFALRSPARPNPLGLAVTRITALDREAGRVGVEAIDTFDGTPLVDLKPWIAAVDIPPAPGEGLASPGTSG